jgi:hypothetical protein
MIERKKGTHIWFVSRKQQDAAENKLHRRKEKEKVLLVLVAERAGPGLDAHTYCKPNKIWPLAAPPANQSVACATPRSTVKSGGGGQPAKRTRCVHVKRRAGDTEGCSTVHYCRGFCSNTEGKPRLRPMITNFCGSSPTLRHYRHRP